MKCYICGDEAVKIHGRSNLCPKHRRFLQMQKTAKADKKYIPSIYEIENKVPLNMVCPDCGIQMHWIDNERRSAGAVLQHYRDGTIGVVCLSCNTKHGLMPGDSYRDVPAGHKLCNKCKTIKPLSMFGNRGKKEKNYPKSSCKACELKALHLWREKNMDRYVAMNRKHNNRRKEQNGK